MNVIKSCSFVVLFVIVCYTLGAQPQVNLELLSNAGVCDTLRYGIKVVNQDDNNLVPTRFVIYPDQYLVFTGTNNNPFVISQTNHNDSIVLIIGGITGCSDAIIEARFYVACEIAKSSVSTSLSYYYNNSEIVVTGLNTEIFKPILAAELKNWFHISADTFGIPLDIQNLGLVPAKDILINISTFSNFGQIAGVSIGTIHNLNSILLNSSHITLAGGGDSGLQPSRSIRIILYIVWNNCLPDLMEVIPYLFCNQSGCTEGIKSIKEKLNAGVNFGLYFPEPLSYTTCGMTENVVIIKNNAFLKEFQFDAFDISIYFSPDSRQLDVIENCYLSGTVILNGQSVPTRWETGRKAYKILLENIPAGSIPALKDLNKNGQHLDLAAGDSLIIRFQLQIKSECLPDCNNVPINFSPMIQVNGFNFCNNPHNHSTTVPAPQTHQNMQISVPFIETEDFNYYMEGEVHYFKLTVPSQSNNPLVQACEDPVLVTEFDFPGHAEFLDGTAFIVTSLNDTIMPLNSSFSGRKLTLRFLVSSEITSVNFQWRSICDPSDYIISGSTGGNCSKCVRFNPKVFSVTARIECNSPCMSNIILGCGRTGSAITLCSGDNVDRAYAFEPVSSERIRLSTGFKNADGLGPKINPFTETYNNVLALIGDTMQYINRLRLDCLTELSVVDFSVILGRNTSGFELLDHEIRAYRRSDSNLLGTSQVPASLININSTGNAARARTRITSANFPLHFPPGTDSIEIITTVRIAEKSAHHFIGIEIEERAGTCTRKLTYQLDKFYQVLSDLVQSNNPTFGLYSSDFGLDHYTNTPKYSQSYCQEAYVGIPILYNELGHYEIGLFRGHQGEFRNIDIIDFLEVELPESWQVLTDKIGIYNIESSILDWFPEYIHHLVHPVQVNIITATPGHQRFRYEKLQNAAMPLGELGLNYFFLIPYIIPCTAEIQAKNMNIDFQISSRHEGKMSEQKNYNIQSNISLPTFNTNIRNIKITHQQSLRWFFSIASSHINQVLTVEPDEPAKSYLYLSSPNPELVFSEVIVGFPQFNDPIPLTESNGIYIGEIKIESYNNYVQIYFNTSNHSCQTDTIFLEWRQNCAVSDPDCSFLIHRDTFITFTELPFPEITWLSEIEEIDPCNETEFVLELSNLGAGLLIDPYINLTLPQGVILENAEFENGNQTILIEAPSPGDNAWRLRWDEGHFNPLYKDSLPDQLPVLIKFSISIPCNIQNPFKLHAQLTGSRICNDTVYSNTVITENIYFVSDDVRDEIDFDLQIEYGADCKDLSHLLLEIIPQSSYQLNLRDSIKVTLAGSLQYEPGTATWNNNSVFDPLIRNFGESIELIWPVSEINISNTGLLSFTVRHACEELCDTVQITASLIKTMLEHCHGCDRSFASSLQIWENISLRPVWEYTIRNPSIVENGGNLQLSADFELSNPGIAQYNGNAKVSLFADQNMNGLLEDDELISELYNGNISLGLNQIFTLNINESILLQEFCLLRILVELPDYCVCSPVNFSIGLEEWIGVPETVLVCNQASTLIENALNNFCSFELPDHPSFSIVNGSLFYQHTLLNDNYFYEETVNISLKCGACQVVFPQTFRTYKFDISIIEENPINCHGDSSGVLNVATLNPYGLQNYTWNLSDENTRQIDGLSAAFYMVTVTDENGCTAQTEYHLTEPLPLSSNSNFEGLACDTVSGWILLNIQGGNAPFSVVWNDNTMGNSLQIDDFGIYGYTITDARGCRLLGNFEIEPPTWLPVQITSSNESCNRGSDGSILIAADPGIELEVLLNETSYGNIRLIENLSSGNYKMLIRDKYGCEQSYEITIDKDLPFSVNIPDTIHLNLGEELEVNATTNPPGSYQYLWTSTYSNLNCISCNPIIVQGVKSEDIILSVSDTSNCVVSTKMYVKVDDQVNIFFPDAFSPNNDGINDLFRPFAAQSVKSIIQFSVYDRWGGELYVIKSPDLSAENWGWDGTFRNTELMPGVYTWSAKVLLVNNKTLQYSGDVLLMK